MLGAIRIKATVSLLDHIISAPLVHRLRVRILEPEHPFLRGVLSDDLMMLPDVPLVDDLDAPRILTEIDRGVASPVRMVAIAAVGVERGNGGSWLQGGVSLHRGTTLPEDGQRGGRGRLDQRDAFARADG